MEPANWSQQIGALIKQNCVLPIYDASRFFYLRLLSMLPGAVFLVLPVSACLLHYFRRLRLYLVKNGQERVASVSGIDGEIIRSMSEESSLKTLRFMIMKSGGQQVREIDES